MAGKRGPGHGKNLSVKMARHTQGSMDESAAMAFAKQTTPTLASPTGPGLQNTMMQHRGGKLFEDTNDLMFESKIKSILSSCS